MTRPAHGPSLSLLRILGIGFGLAVVVGGAIGQGILRAPGLVAGAFPSAPFILAFWVAGGLLALIDAFAVVELGSSVPRAGGPYALAARAFGPTAGALVGWIDWTAQITTVAYLAVVCAEYVHRLGLPFPPNAWLAAMVVATIAVLNLSGTRLSGASQSLGSAAKGIGLLALVLLLFVFGQRAAAAPSSPPVVTLAVVAVAARAVYNTYVGWNTTIYFSEELHAPERNIARATFGGIALIALIYVLMNAALLHVLTPAQIAGSTLPAADAARSVIGASSGTVVTALAVISILAGANLTLMFASRIGYAMALGGIIPRSIARVAGNGTPWVAVLVTAVPAAALAALGGYEQLVAVSAPAAVAVGISLDAAAITLRLREPDLPRPFKMPLFPVPAVLGLMINSALLAAMAYEDPVNTALSFLMVAVLGVAYAGRRALRRGAYA